MLDFNVIVEDAFGNTFHECPRCGSPWEEDSKGNVGCSELNCIQVANYTFAAIPNLASPQTAPIHVLYINLGSHLVQWWRDKSTIISMQNASILDHAGLQDMHTLPYDITREQLKMYLTFS